MANRYMDTFRDDILGWNKKLMNVADVNELMTKIQRTWAYLESLFIYSEEVKKELPDAARRFANIDSEVKSILKVRLTGISIQQPLLSRQPRLDGAASLWCHSALLVYSKHDMRITMRLQPAAAAIVRAAVSTVWGCLLYWRYKLFVLEESYGSNTAQPAAAVRA